MGVRTGLVGGEMGCEQVREEEVFFVGLESFFVLFLKYFVYLHNAYLWAGNNIWLIYNY